MSRCTSSRWWVTCYLAQAMVLTCMLLTAQSADACCLSASIVHHGGIPAAHQPLAGPLGIIMAPFMPERLALGH